MGGFWGIEVNPGQQYPIEFPEDEDARLRITQATLGLGDGKGRSIVQCTRGDKSPIFLCSLLPKKNESCALNLEFEEDEELVTFSVIGKQSIHLSGFFETYEDEGEPLGEDYEGSSGEDIGESGSEESSDYGSDDDVDELIDSDLDMDGPSPPTKSGVLIEDIEDDEKPTNGKGQSKPLLEFNQSKSSEENTKGAGVPVLESEDEDGFPISTKNKTKKEKTSEKTKKRKAKDNDDAAGLNKKVEDIDQERQKKSKKKQQLDEKEKQPEVLKSKNEDEKLASNEKSSDIKMDSVPTEEKKKKKKNKKKSQETEEKANADANVEKSNGKSKVRTFPNGLVIEDVAMGRPDGKRADPGKKVSVRYIGKLKNGKQFDANVRGPPFKFTLGVGQVITGWDVGVKGMRVGDKRRLTVPPSMGYGHKGAPPAIPPNSWLVFDVELVAVN